MDDFILKSAYAILGTIAGAVSGALAMLYQNIKLGKDLQDTEMRLRQIEMTHMPRKDIIDLFREMREEAKDMHKDMNAKLDQVVNGLSDIKVTLERKADK